MKKNITPVNTKTDRSKVFVYFIAISSLLLYINTLRNGYVYDDESLLFNNSLTEKGISAFPEIISGGYRSTLTYTDNELYRPVPKLFFALFWSISPANPFIPHLFNILLYAAINVLLFQVLRKVFQFSYALSALSVLLFIFHPVHTEVVANAKSLDELLSLLFLLSGTLALNNVLNKKWYAREYWIGLLFFLMALLSKESALSFMLLVPVAIYLFQGKGLKKLLPVFAAIAFSTLTYIWLRSITISLNLQSIEKGFNYLASIDDPVKRIGNALFILAFYFRQLVLPINLICDASFNHFGDAKFDSSLLPILLSIGFLVITYFKRKLNFKIYAFGLLFFFAAVLPVSNLLIHIGTNYAERFLLVPSIGFCIFIAAAIFDFIKTKKNLSPVFLRNLNLNSHQIAVLGLILFFYTIQTVKRNNDWISNQTLFSKDILKAPESARLNAYYANALSDGFSLSKISDPNLK